ncbi:ExeM/NucH family extracellular endonuclease [Nocardioides sp. NPDC092400]|uniref:ExeM/NucH family extracellular endonuclease n=1 Tax=Nocardioides sp. NPDC092400 TaxID=3155196 RepID=UPI003440212D
MPSSGRSPRRLLASLSGLAVAATGLSFAPLPAFAAPDGSGLVISEVYGGGGFAVSGTLPASTYANDFIELYNPTTADVRLDGWAVFYGSPSRSAGGNLQNKIDLSGTIPAGGHFLVGAAGGDSGAALPTPDVSGGVNLGANSGLVVLSNQASTISGLPTGDITGASSAVVDAVGYGTANTFEEANQGTALSGTSSANRAATGADTDNNSVDLVVAAPSPTASGRGTAEPEEPTPPATPTARTIAQIQGTGTATSLAGQQVVTRGVVTAVYPSGGLNGFYLQTAGTGGTAVDTTPGASDGIFVYAGTAGFATYPQIGDSVEVTGQAGEYTSSGASLTQIGGATYTALTQTLAPVQPRSVAWYTTDAEREAHEGELIDPTDDFTVTNSYATWQYGEVGLATGDRPLIQPTEVEDAQTGDPRSVEQDNARRLVTLDDGKSQNFGGAASGEPLSWLDAQRSVTVGAEAVLKGAFVVDHRNGLYKLQPTKPVTGLGTDVAEFEDLRAENAAPADVGGDNRIATFNVLNYFPTTGKEFESKGLGTCTYYVDRAKNPVTVNSCTNNGPRGAAETEDFERQEAKIVAAINRLGASVVSLEEIENSVQFGKDRDFALSTLTDALNEAAGSEVWEFVPSPPASELPTPAQEDVIRTAFIYQPAKVAPVGTSSVLIDEVNFDNAREPLAQAFKAVGAPDAEAFGVIVNHFKSKGSGADDGTGQGNANPDRIGQARALDAFADDFAEKRSIDAVFLTGDFNSYSEEDPVQLLEENGWTALESTDDPDEESYSFSGLYGSLDHVFANAAARELVTGVDIWTINSNESVGYQYGRFNNNVVDLYSADPFGASDHNPEIVRLDLVADSVPGPVDPGPVTPGPTDPPTPGPTDPTPGPTDPEPTPTDPTPTDPEPTPEPVTPSIKPSVNPGRIVAGKTRAKITVRVAAEGEDANGWVRIETPGKPAKVVRLKNGKASVRLWPFGGAGEKTLTITYNGRGDVAARTITRTITVVAGK